MTSLRVPPPGLREELRSDRPWRHPWRLAPGFHARPHRGYLAGSDEALLETLKPSLVGALSGPADGSTAIDLACGDGWLCHQLLDLGATRVVGLDPDAVNVRRARMVAAHHRVGNAELEFRQARTADLRPAQLGRFDAVALIGVIGSVDDPVNVLRTARELTGGVCLIETELSRLNPDDPSDDLHDQGREFTAAWTTRFSGAEAELALVPTAAGLEEAVLAAGFSRLERLRPVAPAAAEHVFRTRGVFAARP